VRWVGGEGKAQGSAHRGCFSSNGSCTAQHQHLQTQINTQIIQNHNRGPAVDALFNASHVITSIPPAGLHLYDPVTRDQLRLLKQRAHASRAGDAPPLRWMGVLSSTSVYGDHGGGWVDEE